MFERILNVLWCLLGLATMVNAWSMGLTGKFGPESGLFPFICGAIITACGVGLIFKGSKEAAPNPAWPRAAALGRILGVVAGLLAMAATLPYLGFAVASSLTTFVLLQTVERSRLLESLIITVVSVAVVMLVFGRLLGMNLPRGPWGVVMDAINGLLMGFSVLFTAENLYFCLLGSIVGTLVGVLPGIGPLAALALLLPVTFQLSAVAGLGMLAAIFYGAMYGGSTTSILVNIPGEAASVVTALDGHAMAKQGRAGAALGMAAISSFVAGTLSLVALTFFSPLLASFALKFGPPENFALMVLGLVCTLYMIGGSTIKGVLMIALGFLAAIVGIDIVNGQDRFTLGTVNLSAGIEILSVVIGLYGVSEILMNCETIAKNQVLAEKIKGLWPTFADWRASWKPMMRGSFLGFFLGLVPGGGPVTASFVSYTLERRVAKDPERFGKGAIEGVAGPEAANNAAVSGGMIPLFTLGIPGNAVTALLLGALVMQGVQPGPMFITQRPDLFWGVVASMYVGNVFLLLLNLPLVGLWVQCLRIPYRVLFPLILLLSIVGTYSANKNIFDLWVMIGFGVTGYILRKLQYEFSPFLIAFVLAPMLEQSLRQSMVMSPDGLMIFGQRPIAAVLIVGSLILAALVFRQRKSLQPSGDL